jgi:hypothetical protein
MPLYGQLIKKPTLRLGIVGFDSKTFESEQGLALTVPFAKSRMEGPYLFRRELYRRQFLE